MVDLVRDCAVIRKTSVILLGLALWLESSLKPELFSGDSTVYAQDKPQVTIVVLDPAPGSRWKKGEAIRFRARIEKDGNIVRSEQSHLAAVVRFPAGPDGKAVTERVYLYDDGEAAHGDDEAGDGTRNNLFKAKEAGECVVFWKAEVDGKDYYRQPKQYKITIEPAPDTPPPPPSETVKPSQPPAPASKPPGETKPQPPPPPATHHEPPMPWWVWFLAPVGVVALATWVLRRIVGGRKLPPLEVVATYRLPGGGDEQVCTFVFAKCKPNEPSPERATIGNSAISNLTIAHADILPTHACLERRGATLHILPSEGADLTGPEGEKIEASVPVRFGQKYLLGPVPVSFQWEDLSDAGDSPAGTEDVSAPAEGDSNETGKEQ